MYEYKATVLNVVDGDTIDVSIELGFHFSLTARLRLQGIDAPESHTPEGQKAKTFLEELVKDNKHVIIRSQRTEKYGRFLAEVFFEDGESVNQLLVEAGHAKPYHGGKR